MYALALDWRLVQQSWNILSAAGMRLGTGDVDWMLDTKAGVCRRVPGSRSDKLTMVVQVCWTYPHILHGHVTSYGELFWCWDGEGDGREEKFWMQNLKMFHSENQKLLNEAWCGENCRPEHLKDRFCRKPENSMENLFYIAKTCKIFNVLLFSHFTSWNCTEHFLSKST